MTLGQCIGSGPVAAHRRQPKETNLVPEGLPGRNRPH
jgi:hypothetical protein